MVKQIGNQEKILLIDDEDDVLVIAGKMLEILGFQVITAPDGFKGVDIFKEEHSSLSLVILDLSMPKMDGEATYKQIKEINDKVPVLLATGYSDDTTREQFMELGVRDVVSKPFFLNELSEKLLSVMS